MMLSSPLRQQARLSCIIAFMCLTAAKLPPSLKGLDLGQPSFKEEFNRLDAGPQRGVGQRSFNRWWTIPDVCRGPEVTTCRTKGPESVVADPSIGITPFDINRGTLVMRAELMSARNQKAWAKRFSTGWLSTRYTFEQLHGYFEIVAKLPSIKGFKPAFWLLPRDGHWPKGGEIDVLESIGERFAYHATVHAAPNGKHLETTKLVKVPVDLSAGFHRYGVAWTEREIVWYFDGEEVARATTPPDLTLPMYIIINLGVGGNWAGPPKASAAEFLIEKVSVWPIKRLIKP